MTVLRIPWRNLPAFRTSVALDGTVYRIFAHWNEVGEYWSMDLYTQDSEPLVRGIKLTAGALLAARFADTRLPPGWFVVAVTAAYETIGSRPGRYDMGTRAELLYVSPV